MPFHWQKFFLACKTAFLDGYGFAGNEFQCLPPSEKLCSLDLFLLHLPLRESSVEAPLLLTQLNGSPACSTRSDPS